MEQYPFVIENRIRIQTNRSVKIHLFVISIAFFCVGCGTPEPPKDSIVRLEIADWVPSRSLHGWWGVAPVGEGSEARVNWTNDQDTLMVTPGSYDIFWAQSGSHHEQPLKLAAEVELHPGEQTIITANSGVILEVADWVPSRTLHGWWGAVPAGGAPEERVNWTNNHNGLLLSPDKYDIIWVQSNSHLERPMLLSSDIEIRQGEKVTITVNSGVILEVADWVPTRTLHGWWGAVPAGGAPEERVNWTNNHNALLLPPDKYDIVWVQSGSHRDDPLVLYPGLSIAPDEIHTLSVNSGVRLELTDNAPSLRSGGWWGAVPAGDNSEETVHRTEQADQSLLLPPGIYDIVWKTRHGNDALLLHEQVTVAEGELVVVQPEFPDGMN